MKLIKRNERGFTLIEILVAVAVGAMVVAAASGVIIQLLQSSRTSFHMTALRQVQAAGYWVSQDVLQTQEVPDTDNYFLYVTWTDIDTDHIYKVYYSLQDMASVSLKQFERQEVETDADLNPVSDTTIIVARYIDSSQTSCTWDTDAKILTFTVTATMNEQAETRVYEVKPRALST